MALFINGLPVSTFELKNSLTKQTVEDAVEQYKRDRDPREKLFEFGRCIVHFAVDDAQVKFCTHLRGKTSWFLPFNRGWKDGTGNPPNPAGLKTDFLWKEILTPLGLTDIIENYAQIVERKDHRTGKIKRDQVLTCDVQVMRLKYDRCLSHSTGKPFRISVQALDEGAPTVFAAIHDVDEGHRFLHAKVILIQTDRAR